MVTAFRSAARATPPPPRPVGTAADTHLQLLRGFRLVHIGVAIALPYSLERVVAYLALARGPVSRSRLAGALWPDVPERRAHGDLRSALWRLHRMSGVIERDEHRLALAPDVDVDLANVADLTRALIHRSAPDALYRLPELVDGSEILPGWDEEWLVVERERYRLLRLRALELAGEAFLAANDHARAMEASLASISSEPYRESAHRLLVRIHIAEGNGSEALRAYRVYCRIVEEELGIRPSSQMEELIDSVRRPRGWATSSGRSDGPVTSSDDNPMHGVAGSGGR
jgi:DNA-binding SARP family transcriptional activator